MGDLETARLVARGDVQVAGVDYRETFSPVVKLVSLRMLLTLTAIYDVDLVHWDVVAAFLNAEVDKEVYMRQPQGYNNGLERVLKLKKSIYGLCQSPRVFFLHLDGLLKELGWKRLRAEWAIWIAPKGGFVGCHVDDLLVGAKEEVREELRRFLSKTMTLADLESATVYMRVNISRDRLKKLIYLDQSHYIDKVLTLYNMQYCNPVTTPMLDGDRHQVIDVHTVLLNEEDKRNYQRLIGCLLFLVHGTRPDLVYSVIQLSQFSSRPETHHWECVKRILQYLRGTKHACLTLGKLSEV